MKNAFMIVIGGMFFANYATSAEVDDVSLELIARDIVSIRGAACNQILTTSEVVAGDPLYSFNMALTRVAPSYYSISKNAMIATASPETCVDSDLWVNRLSGALGGKMSVL